ncbi:putative ribonuclease H-like domain-containing protein, partial [Tanacetum coccineum]
GNPQQDLEDKGVIESGCSRHITGNMSYLTDFEEIDGDMLPLEETPNEGKSQAKDNMYSVDLKNIVPKGGLTCLFEKATSDESKLWHRRLGHINLAEAVNTACYVQNRVLVTKPHNNTPYELFLGRKRALGFMKPFRCPVTILNTIDHLGKFDGKADEGFFVSKNAPNIEGSGPNCLFDIDALTISMNYKLVVAGNQSNGNAGTKACDDVGKAIMETVLGNDYILLPLWTADPSLSQNSKSFLDVGSKPLGDNEKKVTKEPRKEGGDLTIDSELNDQEEEDNANSTNNVNDASTNEINVGGGKISIELLIKPDMHELDAIVYSDNDKDVGAEADMNNLNVFMPVNPIPTTRIHKDHLVEQIIGDLNSAPQTRRMTKNLEEHGLFSLFQQRSNHEDFQNYLFACFLSQEKPKKIIHALNDPSWIEAMQEELLQFNLQEVWTLVDLPNGKRAIGTKWVFKNKKNERGILITNKARLVAQGYTQEEVIDYDEIFSPIVRIEAIRLFLACASFKDFVVYQLDVKSAFLYSKIEEEVYVCQPSGLDKKSLCIEFRKMMHKKFQISIMGELIFFLGLQVKQKEDGIFISQDKYVTKILKKFGFTDVKTASTFMETQKPLLKDEYGEEVDVHLYRSMISSLMYLTSSRPDIMFVVCAYARYQVNLKVSHLHVVKRIFRYLKGQPKLGLWYPRGSPFDLVAYTDSDYARASLDRKSIIGGCQFLGCRLISWQCKKQTVVANSQQRLRKDVWYGMEKLPTMILEHKLNAAGESITYYYRVTVAGLVNAARHKLTTASRLFEYALMVNPTIYTSCIEHFWATTKAKTVNEEEQLQALVDKKKVIITESTIRRDLQLEDDEDTMGKFLMYPRFVQVFLNRQLEGMETHDQIYVTLSHTKKVFGNMKRVGKGFSRNITPLFPTMMVQSHEEVEEGLGEEDVSKHKRKIHNIDADEDIILASTHFDTDPDMFGVHDLNGDEVFVETKEPMVNVATTTSKITVSAAKDLTDVDMTLAQALAEIKSVKPKAITTAATTTTTLVTRPMAKGLVIQEQKIAREKEEANAALIAQWNNIQDKVETDYELAQRLQAEEQEELTIAEKVNTFIDMDTEVVGGSEVRAKGSETIAQESSLKRAGDELEQEKAKKQKIDNDQEEAEMKKLMEIVPDEEEVTVEAIPVATKPPSIVD